MVSRASKNLFRYIKPVVSRGFHNQVPLGFHATDSLWGEPLKKKRKLDPQVLIQRELKKQKKIEKQIKKLEKFGRKLKPVDELGGDYKLKQEVDLRKRLGLELTAEVQENRALLKKEWARYKFEQFREEAKALDIAIASQEKALSELRLVSEDLYLKAVKIDPNLVPFSRKGPVTTPPIENYDATDGDFIDTTKVY